MEIAMAIALMIYIIFHTQRIKWIVMLKYIHRPRLLSYTENKMDSDADGFASFLTKMASNYIKLTLLKTKMILMFMKAKAIKVSYLFLMNILMEMMASVTSLVQKAGQ